MGPELFLEEVTEHGTHRGRGNFVGVQPFMTALDYASGPSFLTKLSGYLEKAREREWLNGNTIVVFPEYIGTWLVAAGERRAVFRAQTVKSAMLVLALSHPLWLARALTRSKARDAVKESLFRMKAGLMANLYADVFSRLAKTYGVTIVAGSIVLPSPQISEGRMVVGDGPLYNVSAVFRPDGTLCEPLVRKAFPIEEEQGFLARGSPSDLPVFETQAGRLGVLVCGDSWYPQSYETLSAKGAELVAVPSFLEPSGIWNRPWKGYNGAPPPQDVNLKDIGRLTEGEAWLKYSLAGRLPASRIKAGIQVFLKASLWNLGSNGRTILVNRNKVTCTPKTGYASLTCFWL